MSRTYQIISGDGHLELPPEDFLPFVPERHRDRAPRRIRTRDGGDSWLVEGQPLIHTGAVLTADQPVMPRGRSYWNPDGTRFPGAGSPEQRLAEQDADGIDAEILYPPVMVRQALAGISDLEPYLAIVQGYNSFLGDSYCAVAPDRLIGMAVMPNRGVDSAIAELRRCHGLGVKGVTLTDFPSGTSVVSADDDPFWEAALELGMPIGAHTHFGNPYPPAISGAQPDAPVIAGMLCSRQAFQRPLWTVAQMMVTGVFDRFPELRIYFAETNAGWLPLALEQLDENYKLYEHTLPNKLAMLPSEYLAKHVLLGFVIDKVIVRDFDRVPVDNLMWGSDFPHSVNTYPNSRQWLDEAFADVDPAIRRKICVDTPASFFHLDPSAKLTPTPGA
jgi:predicted TIM-barrel fold metal-dependent hydrolase